MPTVPATSLSNLDAVMVLTTTMVSENSSLPTMGHALGRSLIDLINPEPIDPTTILHDTHYLDDYATSTILNDISESNQMDILKQQQATVGASSLYSIEEISKWATSDCTALIHSLLASFSVILVSELGDKTFIITAIMAMKNSRSLVFISSAMALLSMTILSVGMGVAVTVVPRLYTHYGSIVLFLCFGLKMLKEAYDISSNGDCAESEFDEVKRSLEVEDCKTTNKDKLISPSDPNSAQESSQQTFLRIDCNDLQQLQEQKTKPANDNASPEPSGGLKKTLNIAPIVIKVFTMVFIAEWGDRSQISTVILAAREDVAGVFIGSLSGHLLCTGLAVIGGRFVAEMISVRTMTFLGGIIFLAFATFAIITGPEA